MLINCPKCHKVYEIPDDLIGKTGKKFRCQACSHIWHAMPKDILGFEQKEEDTITLEPIEVKQPPYRPYPSEKEKFEVPLDHKAGPKTMSSYDLILKEGDSHFQINKPQENKPITLTSDSGTSFTIAVPKAETPIQKSVQPEGSVTQKSEISLSVTPKDKILVPQHPKKSGYGFIWFILILLSLLYFLRREIVSFFPDTEIYYQQLGLSGTNNPQYLKIVVKDSKKIDKNGIKVLKVTVEIQNNSHYRTIIPTLTVNPQDIRFNAHKKLLDSQEKTIAETVIPLKPNLPSLTIGFAKP